MAVNYELLNKGGISLSTNFDAIIDKPLDARQVVPSFEGLQSLIDNGGAYAGMVTYVASEKRLYEVYDDNGTLKYKAHAYTEDELKALIGQQTTAAMEFKGATATLPENPVKGDMYKVAGENISITIDGVAAKLGDSVVYDGTQWFLIPSGDDIEDTWRAITGVDNDATLSFVNGDKITASVASDGTVKFNHDKLTATPADVATEEDRKTRTYLTAVEVDEYGHVTNYKTATENVEDTNTTYEFECQVEEGHSNVHFSVKASDAEHAQEICLDAYTRNEVDGKFVAKETGKSLVSDAEIERLSGVSNYDDEEVRGLIGDNADAIDELAEYVGTFTHDTAKTVVEYINAKTDGIATSGNLEALGQRVTANEGKIADLETESAKHALKTELEAVDAKFADYKTAEAQKAIDDDQDRRLGVIEGDYLKAADIADFETKENVKKVADDLAAYVESNDAALAAETKARTDADADFETRIANLEANFGDGEGTVEAQIAAAVAAEAEIARAAEKANADDIDAIEGRMNTAEGKIGALETESAKHATKDELAGVDAKFADYTKTSELPTDLGDFTNNAGYAKTADVNTELDKKADKTQVATDIANAIAPLATTEALHGVDAKFANYTNTTDMNAKFDLKADKTQVATDIADAIAPLATTEALNGVKATAEAATTVEEVDAQIDAKIGALNLATAYEPIGAEQRAKDYADGLITTANLDQYTTEHEVKDIVDGVIKTATSKETLDSLVELVEYIDTHSGDAINMATAIGVLEGKVEVIEEKPAYGIAATQISNWDNEVGAKALAGTKLDASAFTEYSNAHAGDYTNKQIDDAIDADVAAAIEAEVARANGAYDTKGDAAKAQAAAEATAAGALATARTEITTEIGTAISGEVSRADGKYEEKGVAQGIVDALKLGETYEPIGAETRAIAAAKTETENQIKVLAGEGNTSTVKKNADDIADLFEMFQWGEF